MRIGRYDVHTLETGSFALDGGAMFGIVPKPIWSKYHPPDERNRIELALRVLLITDGKRKILVDVGIGTKFSPKLVDIYRIDHQKSDLHAALKRFSLGAEDITDVILTHLHFDHAGGATERKNGEVVPTYQRARYYVQKAHWDLALNPTEKDRGSFMSEDFLPLRAHGVLEFLEGETDIFPGIHLLVVNGHTNAQQLIKITGDGKSMLYVCDLVPTAAHLPFPYVMAYDLRPLITIEEKRRILGEAYEEGTVLVYEHDPQVQSSTIKAVEKGFALGENVVID